MKDFCFRCSFKGSVGVLSGVLEVPQTPKPFRERLYFELTKPDEGYGQNTTWGFRILKSPGLHSNIVPTLTTLGYWEASGSEVSVSIDS